ncbi:MAG: RHS repeat-associated core domain-containing protein [Bacteroidales bacterium]|nr:RHS repeat-associated core domain-containing protein [Bacteroidales bacterium]
MNKKYINNTLDTERRTLHLSDDEKRFAIIDTLTIENGEELDPYEVTIRYQYDNHLGSACLELDENASIISYEEYHPFGTTSYRSGRSQTEVSLKRYKYCGKERDEETGLYYYGMRYYAAWICRFVSVDPLQFKYPHYTPYQYAGNKPISYIDLDGGEEKKPDSSFTAQFYPMEIRVKYYKRILESRLKVIQGLEYEPIPEIEVDTEIFAEGRYENEKIILNSIISDETFGYQLSLVNHEYKHHLNECNNVYPLKRNSDGSIVQWETKETYLYIPTQYQIDSNMESWDEFYIDYYSKLGQSKEYIEKMRTEYYNSISTPQERKFSYAPSNLALDEISAYEYQLEGEKQGLYILSEEDRNKINDRIDFFKFMYNLRVDYEKRNGLNPDGSIKN